ncbi:hypothetical protein [Cellulomonas sp. S1-8]|uniref:hypothetical protein n=1 Tax=Cellulomonas sp. S1-8 TaxID=2904790 RepID=UPI0022449AF3|nr:hypothetical protein [Cellulomonas sp. S1-8]UZN04308.1 hypothetical protein OKX07_05075 [Cellulomonas sp. S1-8]
MSDEQAAGRRTWLPGALAGVVAAAVVVAAALATAASDPTATGPTSSAPTAAPTVASATADAVTTSAPDDAPAAPGTDASTPVPSASPLAQPVQDVVDLVLELESGSQVATPVGLGADVEALPGVRVAIDRVQVVDGQGVGPGESSGPALALDVRITNDSGAAVSADGLVVNIYGTDGVPGSQLLGDPRSVPLQGDIAGGTSAQGVYVLTGPGGSTTGPHVVSIALGAGSATALVVLTPEAG